MLAIMNSHPDTAIPGDSGRRRLSHKAAFALKASIVMSFLAASTVPSPLYAIWREQLGFSALTLTLVFSCYAFALLSALLVFGGISDFLGRRSVLLAAIALDAGAMLLFYNAESVGWLFAARVLQGVATGVATATLSAGLLDLHREHGALVNAVSPMLGMGVGAVGTGMLVTWAPSPTKLAFLLLIIVFVVQGAAAWFLPETVARRAGAWKSLKPSIALPAQARGTMWRILPYNTAAWALGGLFLSLGPTLLRSATHQQSPLLGSLMIAVLVFCGAVGVVLARTRQPRHASIVGAHALLAGLVVMLGGILSHSAIAMFAGTAISGVGFGAGFISSVRRLVPLAEGHERAALMSSFYVFSYLAFSVPAIIVGLVTGWAGLVPTTMGYAALLAMLTLIAIVAMKREARLTASQ